MILKTTKLQNGDWKVVGLPFVIGKCPHPPKWGERQEWLILDARDLDRVLASGFWAKADALAALSRIVEGVRSTDAGTGPT